ncbi:DUF6531 domain-containing protein [Lachnospiraceae bacterium OttesenSCG-928-J05]|nr:DUF6531 domain-containing protein [Lachnospiraceae bacterium OttesenSCG-928-J05]
MTEIMRRKIKTLGKRLLAYILILTMWITPSMVSFAEEIGEKAIEIKDELEKASIRDEQQEYIEENGINPELTSVDEMGISSEETEDIPLEIDLREPEVLPCSSNEYEELYGEPVEINEYGRVYYKGNGTYVFWGTSEQTTYEEDGEYREVDNTLVEEIDTGLQSLFQTKEENTSYVNKENENSIELPAIVDTNKGIKLEDKDGRVLEIFPVDGDYSEAVVKENALLYNHVHDGIDVQYTAIGHILKEDIILRNKGERNQFSYSFAKNYVAELRENIIYLYDKDDQEYERFILTAPAMSDATGAESHDVTLNIEEKDSSYIVTITADKAWLDHEDRVYPVKVDPTITIGSSSLQTVTTTSLTNRYAVPAYGYVGFTDDYITGIYDSKLGKTRMLFNIGYNFSQLSTTLNEDAWIKSASLNVYSYSMNQGTPSDSISCYRIKTPWDYGTIGWEQSTGLSRTVSGEQSALSIGRGWKNYDIRDAVIQWSSLGEPNYGLMLMANNESAYGSAFYTPYSSTGTQPGFKGEYPSITIEWEYPDSVDINYSLDDTTIGLRSIVDVDMGGKIQFLGVLADGIATPDGVVNYALSDDAKDFKGTVSTGKIKKYPNTAAFEDQFPKTATRYRDKLGNWQTPIPFTEPELDTLYTISGRASKGNMVGTWNESEKFTIYKVKQYDTLPRIAAYYGIPISQMMYDNRVADMLLTQNNTLFIRNPQKNGDKPYNPPPLDDALKAKIDAQLMGRGLHCEFDFEPVNLNTGNFYYNIADATISELSGDFSVERNYNSKKAAYMSSFGRGWQFSFDEYLSQNEDGTLLYTRDDGSVLQFTENGTDNYVSPEGYNLKLKKVKIAEKEFVTEYDYTKEYGPNNWTSKHKNQKYDVYEYEIIDSSQTIKRFNCYGSLSYIVDCNDNRTDFIYDSNYNLSKIKTATGKEFGFTITETGTIKTISLPNGGVLEYEYDDDNNLISYKDTCGATTHYEYDDKHQMTAWYDGKNQKIIENTYDKEGRVLTQLDANGYLASFSYADSKTTTTDGNGNETTYVYDEMYRTKEIRHPDGNVTLKTYKDNYLASETDPLGHTTTFVTDDNGNIIRETRFDGSSREFTYDSENNCISETDFEGVVTSYEFDNNSNLLSATKNGVKLASYSYDGLGRVVETKDGNKGTTKFTYTGASVDTITNPDNGIVALSYNTMGLVTEVTDSMGGVIRKTYDLEGRVLSETDQVGNTTLYTLDENGQAIGMQDGNGNIFTFAYDGLGNLIAGTDSDGASFSYSYDGNGNCILEKNGNGDSTIKTYNSMNYLTTVTNGEGHTTTYTYDGLGNVLTETDPKGNTSVFNYNYINNEISMLTDGEGNIISNEFSLNGNLLKQTYADSSCDTYAYDELGRVIQKVEANGLVIDYVLDDVGNILSMDKDGIQTVFKYDSMGRNTKVILPNGGEEKNTYDKNGNLIEKTDALGNIASYVYDKANRVSKARDAENGETAYGYDGNGNINQIKAPNGGVTTIEYNSYNKPVQEIDPLGNVSKYIYSKNEEILEIIDAHNSSTKYEYDATGLPIKLSDKNGNCYEMTYDENGLYESIKAPDGGSVKYEYNAVNQVVKERDSEGLITEYEYSSRGQLIKQWDNNDGITSYTYDEKGNLLTETNALDEIITYEYDKYDNLIKLEEANGNVTSYTYDVMNNLTAIIGPDGKETSFTYDKAGNMLKTTEPGSVTTEYTYDKTGRVLTETNSLNEVTTFSYDKEGNLVSEKDPLGNSASIIYDLKSQVIGYKDKNENLTTLEYDALGRVINSKFPLGTTETYSYDSVGNILREVDMAGANTSYEYDVCNRMVKKTSSTGGVTSYTYNTHGMVLSENHPSGGVTVNEYDLYDQLTKKTLPGEAVYSYSYDKLGRISSHASPEGLRKNYTYDQSGNLIKEIDQGNREVAYTYDIMDRLIGVSNPLGGKTSYSYDDRGNLLSVVTPTGSKTTYSYDKLDRINQEKDPTGLQTKVSYDKNGNILEIIEGVDHKTTYQYDKNGNKLQETDALGQSRSYAYDAMNQLLTEKDWANQETKYEYDNVGRLSTHISAKGTKTYLEYDSNGNLTEVIDGSNRKMTYVYDKADRLVQATAGDGVNEITSTYQYDNRGNLTSLTDGNGNTTNYSYNKLDQITKEANPLGNIESYSYDINARLCNVKRASGKMISYEYNKLDEQLKTSYSDSAEGEVLYAYDRDGRRVSMSDLTGNSTYTYDDCGRITGVKSGDGNIILYNYDSYGNLSKLTYPDGSSVSYKYDTIDRLISVKDREGKSTTYEYDKAGNTAFIKRANGTVAEMLYDEVGQILAVENKDTNGHLISSYNYTYDYSGNIIIERIENEEGTTNWTYSYNDRGELVAASATGATTASYTYGFDKAGNKIAINASVTNAKKHFDEVITNRYNGDNQLISSNSTVDGETSYVYDKDGNLIRALNPNEKTLSYTYDTENRLRAIHEGDSLLQAALYDGDDNRTFVANRKVVTDDVPVSKTINISNDNNEKTETDEKKSVKKVEPKSKKDKEEATENPFIIEIGYFLYGLGQTLIQGFSMVDSTPGKGYHESYEDACEYYYVNVKGEDANQEGIVKNPINDKKLKNKLDSRTKDKDTNNINLEQRSEEEKSALYTTVFIPAGTNQVNRDTYLYTNYINDINQEYTQVLQEYGSRGTSTYEYGNERLTVQENDKKQTYVYDGKGSVSELTDSNGSNIVSYSYDVYGNASTSTTTSNPYNYRAEYTDYITGNQYLRSRYYSPDTGGFMTKDTYLGSLLEPLTQNRYTYAGNNPINIGDPGGDKWKGAISSFVSKAITSAVKAVVNTVKTFTQSIVYAAVNKVPYSYAKAVIAVKRTVSNLVSVGGKLVSVFEKKMCTTALKISKQSTAVAIPTSSVFAGIMAGASGPGLALGVIFGGALAATGVIITDKEVRDANAEAVRREQEGNTVSSEMFDVWKTEAANEGISGSIKFVQAQDVDINNLPEGWTRTDNNGRTHVRDGNGKIRVRIDPPDGKTDYRHRHNYDEDGNSLDKDGNVVDRKSPDGHIPYDGD